MMYEEISFIKHAIYKMEGIVRNNCQIESGGLIYGRFTTRKIKAFDISDVGPKSTQTTHSISFDLDYLVEYTMRMLEEDLYVIGTWHSHPKDSRLSPSSTDFKTMLEIKNKLSEALNPIFCICGISQGEFTVKVYTLQEDEVLEINSEKLICKEE